MVTERDAIDRVAEPVTVEKLTADLRDLGVAGDDVLVVHSSLSSLGWVNGGAPAVVDALRAALDGGGTLVAPTHTGQYTDPAVWSNPPVPDDWVEPIRETRPPYRPAVTPTRSMGAIPECFRCYPDVRRSRHPTFSFAALGPDAEAVTADHSYDDSLGEGSPLARVYERAGRVLLLGVGHDCNTSLHLAEYRADYPKERATNRVPVVEDGERRWVEYADVRHDTADFAEVGAAFERAVGLVEGTVGAATAKLLDQVSLVDFAVKWFERNR